MTHRNKRTKDDLQQELGALKRQLSGGVAYSLFDQVPLPYQSLDVDGNIITVNKAWLSMLGYSLGEVLGTWFGDYLEQESMGLFKQQFCLFKSCGQVEGAEFFMICKDGSRVLVYVDGQIGYDSDGNVLQTHCIVHDITERRRAEKKVAAKEQQFRGLFETSTDGIVFVDTEGTLRDVNPAFSAMLGSSREALLGKHFNDIVVLDTFEVSWDSFVQSMEEKTGTSEDVCLALIHSEGYRVSVAARFWAVKNESPGAQGVWVTVKDVSKAMQAEAALRKSESQYRRIVETANEGIIGLDVSMIIVFSNQVLADFLGYERHELLGRPVDEIFFPEGREEMVRQIGLMRKDGTARYECPFQCKKGALVWGLVSATVLTSESGEITGSFAMVADITERKKVESALRRSQDLLNEAQRISGTGGWDVDLVTKQVYWTDEQCRLHGMEPGYIPAQPKEVVERFVHPDDRAGMLDMWEKVTKGSFIEEFEYRVLKPDGSESTCVKAAIPVMDHAGKVIRVYGSTRDVTREREVARELEQAHNRLLSILDGIDADIYVSDLNDTNILFMNAHMRDSFQVPEGDVCCHEVFRREDEPCSHCPKPYLLDESGHPVKTIITERYNNKSERWYLNHDRAIEWLEGNLVHMHLAADITELKALERSLTMAMADAESASVAKNEFLANMSHEIRTPLNGLLGMLQILQLTSLVDEQRDYLTTALDSGRNLLQILNDILDLSKIESGKMDFEEDNAELGEVLDSVVSVFRHVTETRGVSMSWHIDESLPRHFMVDKGRLRQILFNLIGNAAKFTESGSVTAEAYPLPVLTPEGRTRVFFSVTDTGIGIPEDKIDLMFDPFTQVDGSASRKYQGTGLGLGIVHRLVSMMGGTITVSSQVGIGTTIAFTVALTPGESFRRHDADVQEEGDKVYSILVAEDEHINRIVVERLLSKLGHSATCVEDGEKAVEILRSGQSFDCLLTDIQMPGMDGVETTRVIREELGLSIPIIALTAHAMKGDQKRFMAAGMDGYIAKPFEMGELQKEIKRIMTKAVR